MDDPIVRRETVSRGVGNTSGSSGHDLFPRGASQRKRTEWVKATLNDMAGVLSFSVERSGEGVLITRRRQCSDGLRLCCHANFLEPGRADMWLREDTTRFAFPLPVEQARKRVGDLLTGTGRSAANDLVLSLDRAGDEIAAISSSEDEAVVQRRMAAVTKHMGFDGAIFCSVLRTAPAQIHVTVAAEAAGFYAHEAYLMQGQCPYLHYAGCCTDPISGETMSHSVAEADAIREVAEGYGFRSVLVVPGLVTRPSSHTSVLILGSTLPAFFESGGQGASKMIAKCLAMELHLWRVSAARKQLVLQAQLTDIDIELLRHERKGLRTKDIARRLSMTTAAIDSRFQRLNGRLGVPSRKAAASLAAAFGLV